MKISMISLWILLVCLLFAYTAGQTNESRITNLETNLLYHKWENQESPCLQKTLDMLSNLKNQTLWATWVWDSMQSPSGVLCGTRNQLGNFEQCIHPPWIQTHPELMMQYCLADIVLAKEREVVYEDPYVTAGEYVSSWSKNKFPVNKLTWGLCLPTACKRNSIKKIAATFLNNSHLGFALPEASIRIHSCQVYNENTERSYGYYATFAFIGIMALITLISTLYYEYHRNATTANRGIILAKAFSITENTANLFKENKNAIRSLNSLKFLTSCLGIYQHLLLVCMDFHLIKDHKGFERMVKNYSLHIWLHAEIILDTFIMISGILLVNNLSATNKPINFVIKRYVRLTYVPIVLMLYETQVLKYNNSGPFFPNMVHDIENCKNNWWTLILPSSNYVDLNETCFLITWYNAVDFHLTLLGTALYWIYQKNHVLGLKVYFIGALASVVLPTISAFSMGLGPIPFEHYNTLGEFKMHLNFPIYLHSHLRAGPFFIGLAFGCLLCAYKPADYTKLSRHISIIIFTFGFGLALFILMLGGHLASTNYSAIEAAIYAGTNRTIWAIAMGAIIVSCEYGHIPLISDFLRSQIFGPLSKLCFGLYLTNWLVLNVKLSATLNPDNTDLISMAIDCLGVITFCCGLSYLLWLLFEAPMNNVVAIVLRNRSRIEIENKTSSPNGVPPNGGKKMT